MNNNIGNMNSANPLGFNPQGHKAPCGNECCKPEGTQEEIYEDKDLLKLVPGDNYGRAMVNKAAHPAVEATNIEDDIFTYQLLMDFTQDLINGYIGKGVEPQKAHKMAAITLDVLLNSQKA